MLRDSSSVLSQKEICMSYYSSLETENPKNSLRMATVDEDGALDETLKPELPLQPKSPKWNSPKSNSPKYRLPKSVSPLSPRAAFFAKAPRPLSLTPEIKEEETKRESSSMSVGSSSSPHSSARSSDSSSNSFNFIFYVKDEIKNKQETDFTEMLPKSSLRDLMSIPIKIEKTLGFGLLLCVDALLYELTLMPLSCLWVFLKYIYYSVVYSGWRGVIGLLRFGRNGEPDVGFTLSVTEKVDLLRFSILFFSVMVFNSYVDFSVLYHYLRAQSLLKLYFIFNMLEILERLVRSWGSDLMDNVVANFAQNNNNLVFRWVIGVCYTCLHAHVHFWRILLVSVALVSSDSSMFMIVVTNNFAEIKGTVFKKYEIRSLYPVLASDVVERLYLIIDVGTILFSLLTSPQQRRMPLGDIFFWVAAMAGIEILTDWIKYMCIGKFNQLASSVFDEFHRLHQTDVIAVRSDEGIVPFKGVVSYSHGSVRRLHFQALPLTALIVFQLFSATLSSTSIWAYRFYVLACCFVLKFILSVFLLGSSLKNSQVMVRDKIATVKAL